jgi:hypothetical protein
MKGGYRNEGSLPTISNRRIGNVTALNSQSMESLPKGIMNAERRVRNSMENYNSQQLLKPNEEFPYGGASIRNQKNLYRRFEDSSSYKSYKLVSKKTGRDQIQIN